MTTTKLSRQEAIRICYGTHNKTNVDGWETLNIQNSIKNSSLDAQVYKKGNKIVIAYAGTNTSDKNDIANSAEIMFGSNIPGQFYHANKMYKKVKQQYPNADIEFTGYSLGGSIANLMSRHTGYPSTAVAPVGSEHIVKKHPEMFPYTNSDIDTYGFEHDTFYNWGKGKQSGDIHSIKKNTSVSNNGFVVHLLKNYLKSMTEQATGYAAPINDGKTFFATEDIDKMSNSEFSSVEDIIKSQLANRFAVPKAQAQVGVYSGNYIYVREYVRDDGTRVRGYYRIRG